MNMKEINDVHAIVEIGEDNTTALIVDPDPDSNDI